MFIEIPATKKSLGKRKIAFGVGVNDAPYIVSPKINGKTVSCPYYAIWRAMLQRCYSNYYHRKKPTYKDCYVCDEWLIFSNFRSWMIGQDWEGKHIDKDIIEPGNKEYRPDKCAFVTLSVNALLTDSGAKRGDCHIGVHFQKDNKRFVAYCGIMGERKYLGCYGTENEAIEAYKKAKYAEVVRVAKTQADERVRNGLLLHADLIMNGCS